MFKTLLKLFAFIILIFTINVVFIKSPANIISTFDLIFLNFDKFEFYHLSKINFQYIICFCLYNNMIIYYTLSEISESNTYLSMIVYRIGIFKSYILLVKKDLKKLFLMFLTSFITLSLLTTIYSQFSLKNLELLDFLLCFIYMIRYYLMILIFSFIYNFLSIYGKNLKGLYIVNMIFIILLLIDIFFGVIIVTFSGIFICEIKNLLLLMLILIVIFCLNIIMMNKKGDIL